MFSEMDKTIELPYVNPIIEHNLSNNSLNMSHICHTQGL